MFGAIIRRSLAVVSVSALATLVLPLSGVAQAAGGDGIDDYSQCQNGSGLLSCTGWTNGILNASNSTYREDGVTPQRLVMGFTIPGAHTVQISYLTLAGTHHAYDSLATWNHTETAANRCQDIIASLCVGGAVSTFPIPADPTPVNPVGAGISNVTSAHQLSGQHLELYGGTLTGALNQAHGTYAPDYGSLLVSLTTTTANSEIMLLFGGHIAAGVGPRGWGAGLGAGGTSGGNYHIRITNVDGTTIGNRDNQLMSGAIALNDTTIATSAQAGGTTGGTIKDHATLSGATTDAVGTITFNLYGPVATNTPTCTGAPVFTSTVNVQPGVLEYDSAEYTVTQPGYYFWVASYSGDVSNKASAGTCGATGETTHVVKNIPGIYTAATTPVEIGTAISDIAHLTGLVGTPTAAQVTFQVYGDNACATPLTAAALATTSVTPSGSEWVFVSATYTPTATGSYYWRASYTGDGQNAPVAGDCQAADETSVVGKRQPSLATHATATAPVGSAITDRATVSGVYGPLSAGDVTFKLYSDARCTVSVPPAVIDADATTLTHTGETWDVTSNAATPATAGTYYWRAFYAGNANNLPVSGACGADNETSLITRLAPALSTSATPSVVIGSTISDVATLTGVSGTLSTGEVTFRLFNDSGCANQVGGTIASVSATSAGSDWTVTSDSVTPTAVGIYYWIAAYAGNANNAPISGACNATDEHSAVTKSQPGISTQATEIAPVLGGLIHDTAYLTDIYGPVATSEVSFSLYDNNTCTGPEVGTPAAVTSTQRADGTWVVVSDTVAPPAAGTYYWRAFYAGNAANLPVAGECLATGETSTVTKATPAITTTATDSVPVGGQISDVAHLTGFFGTPAAADVTFTAFSDSGCIFPIASVGGIAVSAAGSNAWDVTSDAVTISFAGSYYWIASFAGDPNNDAVSGACGDANETSVVTKLAPQISTAAQVTVTVGDSATDTAYLTGVFSGTTVLASQLSFNVYSDGACGTLLGTVSGATATKVGGVWQIESQPFTTTHTGTLYWQVSYAGDANNDPIAGGCSDESEQSTVSPRSPLISTLTSATAVVGDAVTDTAHLTGIFGPVLASDVSFVLYSDVGCTIPQGSAAGVSVTGGNGTWTVTSGPVTPAHTGAYHWIASYGGNSDNAPVAGTCSDTGETVTVTPAQPALGTVATPTAPVGSAIHDVATISGVFGPLTAAQVHFALYFGADCSGPATAVATASVSNAGAAWTVTSADYTMTAAGTYHWIASYTGNADNAAVTGTCGDPGENSQVGDLTVVKAVDHAVADYGDLLTYTLTATAHSVDQHDVVVTDVVPVGTTYVSSSCVLPCTSSYDAATRTVTWSVGTLLAGSSVDVRFVVRITLPPANADGSRPGTEIDNVGSIRSAETPVRPSNVVTTKVPGVKAEKIVKHHPPARVLGERLAKTGPALPLVPAVWLALMMIAAGVVLSRVGRARR